MSAEVESGTQWEPKVTPWLIAVGWLCSSVFRPKHYSVLRVRAGGIREREEHLRCPLTIALLFSAYVRSQNTRKVLLLHEGNTNHPANVPARVCPLIRLRRPGRESHKAGRGWLATVQRWGIRERNLLSSAIVQFRTPAFWDLYKSYVLAGLMTIIAQSAVIFMLVIEIRRRKKSELEIKNLSRRLVDAGEEERKRIASELHGDIAQRLSLVCMDLYTIEADSQSKVAPRCSVESTLQQVKEIVSDVHNLSHQLHSSKLQMLGLEAALREVCRHLAKQHNVEIQLAADDLPIPLREGLSLCFYRRVAQEALNNSVKHSGSTRIEVRVVVRDGSLKMIIRDFGAGSDPKVAADGLGLATMRERLRLVEGELLVNSKPGGGTEIAAQAVIDPSHQLAR